eukprot:258166_1
MPKYTTPLLRAVYVFIWTFSTLTQSIDWMSYSKLPVPLDRYSIGFNQDTNTVYLFGGHNGTQYVTEIWKWDIHTPQSNWIMLSTKTPTSIFDSRASSVTIGHLVYFVGIFDGDHANGKVHLFNLTSETFVIPNGIPDMPVPCVLGCVASDETLIVVAGGADPGMKDVLQIYEIATNTWWNTFTLPYVSYQSMCSYDITNDILYFFGGASAVPSYGVTLQSFYYTGISTKTSASAWNHILGPTLSHPHISGHAVYDIRQDVIYLLGGEDTIASNAYVEVFDTTSKSLSSGNNLYSAVWGHSAMIIDNRIMIWGGIDTVATPPWRDIIQYSSILVPTPLPTAYPTTQPTASCTYDTNTLPFPMYGHSMVYSNDTNSVYLFGGYDSSVWYNSIYKWDMDAHSNVYFESTGITTPTPVFYSVVNNVVTIDNIAYFIGINNGASTVQSFYAFDMQSESWLNSNNYNTYPIAGVYGCLATNRVSIFMVGGRNYATATNVDYLQMYNIALNQWTTQHISMVPIASNGWDTQFCEIVDDRLFVFGGSTSPGTALDSMYKYHIQTTQWSYIGTLPKDIVAGNSVYYNPYIYIIGGNSGDGSRSNLVIVFAPAIEEIVATLYTNQNKDDLFPLVIQSQLHIFGGRDIILDAVSSVEVCDLYDATALTLLSASPTNLTWASPLNSVIPQSTRSFAYALAENDVLYILSGNNAAGASYPLVYSWNYLYPDQFGTISTSTAFYCATQCAVSVSATPNLIYIVGAQNAGYKIFVFDIQSQSYAFGTIATMPYPVVLECVASNHVDRLFLVGGWDETTSTSVNYLQTYDVSSDQWQSYPDIASLPDGVRHQGSMCVYWNEYVYVFGGRVYDLGTYYSSIYRYDIEHNTWSLNSQSLVQGKSFGRAVYSSYTELIYIIGGTYNIGAVGHGCNDTVEIFDPKTDTMMKGTHVPQDICYFALVSYSDEIAILGGYAGSTNTYDTVYTTKVSPITPSCDYYPDFLPATTAISGHAIVYDEDTHNAVYLFGGLSSNTIYKWTVGSNTFFEPITPTTPTARLYAVVNSVATIGDLTYFIGVDDGTAQYGNDKVYVFNIQTESWMDTNNYAVVPYPANHGCVATNQSLIFMIGGRTGTGDSNYLQIYDVFHNTWSAQVIDIAPYTANGWEQQMCQVVHDVLFVFGGRYDEIQFMDGIYKYHINNKQWLKIGALPLPNVGGTSVYHEPFIYLIGGSDYGDPLDTILTFNPLSEQIVDAHYMQNKRYFVSALSIAQKLFVFGGIDQEAKSSVEMCDILIPSFSMQILSDNGRFIWVGPQTTDFFTADNYCEEQYDTSLASVHSEDENIEISNLCTANAATQVCYIGLNDGGIEGTFVWADGSHLDYLPSSFEPDNAEHGDVYEDCVAVMSGGEWLDTTCNLYHPHSFICNAPTSSPTKEPTNELTVDPTFYPTFDPSDYPTIDPSKTPTESPSQNPTFTPTEKPTEDFGKKHKDCERLKVALTLILQNTTNNENEDTFYYVVKGNPSKMTTIIKRNIDSVSDNDSFADHLNIELIDVANPSLNRVKLNYNITNCNNHIVVDVYLNSSNFTEELTDDINQEYGNIVADITTHIVHILPPPLDLEDLSVSNPVTWALAVAFILLVIFFICSSCHNNVCDVLSCLPWFHAVDESKPGNVLFFVLTVGTFFFQCNNIYVLSYYYVNNMDRSSIILSSAIILSAIVFIQIIIQPLFAACYTFKFTKSEHPTEYEELCNTYWSGRKGAILFLIIISGSFYMTLELLNSRVFGVELFWMGMTETSLKQYGIFQKIGTLLLFMSTVIHMLCSIHFHTIGHDKEISGFFIAALVAHSLSSIHEIGVHCSEPLEHQHYDFVLSVVVDDKEDRKTLEENAGKTKELRRELAMELEVEMDKIQIGKVQRTGTGIKIYAQYICYSVYSSSRLDEIVRHAQIRPKRQRLDETLAKSQMKQFQSNWENCQSDALRLQEIIKKVYQLSTYPKSVKNNTNIANAIELQHTIVHTDYELLHDLK